MAQYYNLVTNASGTITLEDVQRICSVEGQSVQFVVEDVNNGGNGSPQFVTYAAAPQNNEQTIFSPQTINIGGQIATTQLDQRQNFYIIKTNEISASQNILKTNTINTHVVSENIVNIVDHKETKVPVSNSPEGQNMQWVKMPEGNIDVETVFNENTLAKNQSSIAIRNQQQNSITSPLLHSQGPCSQAESQPFSPIEKKPVRLYQNRNRQSIRGTQSVATSNCLQAGRTPGTPGDHILNSNLINNRNCTPSFRLKTFCTSGSDVNQTPTRQVRTSIQSDNLQTRNSIPLQSSRNPSPIQYPEMEHLSERIKQARLIQMQVQRQVQHNHQQQSQQQRQPLNNPTQRQQMMTNAGQQRQQVALLPQPQAQVQRQTMMSSHQSQQQMTISSPDHCIQEPMDIDLPDSTQEREKLNQQSCTSQTDAECNSTESYAYLQKVIDNPQTTIVQQQLTGNTVKMLVILLNGEQRLITFDIPSEDCTVQDLLEQTNITFPGEPTVSLVSDPALGINYIVEPGPIHDGNEQNESNPSQEITNMVPDSSSPTFNASDENSNSSITQNEEPKYVEGMLAVCPHCGISSPDFNRCLRCKTKLPEDVKAIPIAMHMQAKKENMLTIDVKTFYKKSNEQNTSLKLDKLERDGSVSKRGRGRGRTARSKPAKEPECLTISSDEENEAEGKSKVKVESDNNNTSMTTERNATSEEMEMILEKEPIITNNCSMTTEDNTDTEEGIKGGGKECEVQSAADGTVPILHTSLLCRTVRIGSYKYVPREKITISQSGVRLGVPLLEDDRNFVTLNVKLKDIVKVLIHFGKSMPVLFFYTTANTGAMIRELLGMQDPKGPYYDPAGRDHTHKRITLLPEKLSEESKIVLKTLFSSKKLEKLNPKEANDILVRASPKDSLQVQSVTRRQCQTTLSNNTSINSGIQTIMVYPPPPAKGGIAINTEDYACLGEDQFLNDVIIDFYLKYLTLEVLSETDQNRTHVFSSYFYKRLTSPHALATENVTPLSPAAKRHARVQKWTKNVNIFEKDFIIIPINEHAHWFLAIICFPGLVGTVPVVPPNVKEHDIQKIAAKSKKLKDIKLQAVTIGSTTITPVATTITIDQGDDGSERDEAEGDDEEMEMDSDEEEESESQEESAKEQAKLNLAAPQQKDIVKIIYNELSNGERNFLELTCFSPCILIFDSLAGASRSRVVATLRDYLSCEHLAKIGTDKIFSKDTIKGASPKVPQQSNFTDCGLYVLQYVESFFKDPITDYTLSIKTLKNWFEEIVVTRKREELSKLLVKLMNATKGDKNITLPVLTFPTKDGKLLPKPENHVELKPTKPEIESKKKPTSDRESRISNNSTALEENSEQSNELNRTTTYQIIPYSPSSSCSSTESNQTEMFTEAKTLTRSSSETMTYLKAKRIPRLMLRMSENQDDKPTTKKHKGDSFDSCK